MKLLPHTSRLTVHVLAGAQAAGQRRTGLPTRLLLHVPAGWGQAKRRRQVHRVRHTRRVSVRSPPTFFFHALPRLTSGLRLSTGEGGDRPATVRQTCATRKPLISRTKNLVA